MLGLAGAWGWLTRSKRSRRLAGGPWDASCAAARLTRSSPALGLLFNVQEKQCGEGGTLTPMQGAGQGKGPWGRGGGQARCSGYLGWKSSRDELSRPSPLRAAALLAPRQSRGEPLSSPPDIGHAAAAKPWLGAHVEPPPPFVHPWPRRLQVLSSQRCPARRPRSLGPRCWRRGGSRGLLLHLPLLPTPSEEGGPRMKCGATGQLLLPTACAPARSALGALQGRCIALHMLRLPRASAASHQGMK